jgi:hypothetical protein
MFGDLLDLDFSPGGWGGDIDWDAIIGALSDMDLSDAGELFWDSETGQIVDAATAAAEEYSPDLDLSGSGSGPVGDDPFSGSLDESPLSRSTSDMLRGLDAEGQEGDLWREQMDPFTGLTAQMPESGFDWMKLLRAAGSGLSGLLGGGGGDNPLASLLGGAGRPLSVPPLGDTALGGVPSVGGAGVPQVPGAPSQMGVMGMERSLPGGGGGMYGEVSVPGMAGTPSQYVRDPVTGMMVPAPAQTPQGAPTLQLSPFTPLIIPSQGGGQLPMAMQPQPRLSGLQRLLQEL